MPRDEWAKAKTRDVARRAIRSGQYDRLATKRKNKKRQAKSNRANRAKSAKPAEPLSCPSCGSSENTRQKREFKDHSTHIEVRCANCRRFIKWEGR
jgi:hypothetical protein